MSVDRRRHIGARRELLCDAIALKQRALCVSLLSRSLCMFPPSCMCMCVGLGDELPRQEQGFGVEGSLVDRRVGREQEPDHGTCDHVPPWRSSQRLPCPTGHRRVKLQDPGADAHGHAVEMHAALSVFVFWRTRLAHNAACSGDAELWIGSSFRLTMFFSLLLFLRSWIVFEKSLFCQTCARSSQTI